MTGWADRNSSGIQAIAAIIMAATALAAVVFVPWQIAAAERTSREQAAREIYREFLNISIQKPELVVLDYCALTDPAQTAGYEAYVEYLLYTAEQVLTLAREEWGPTLSARLAPHRPYLCTFDAADLATMTDPVSALVGEMRQGCADLPECPRGTQ